MVTISINHSSCEKVELFINHRRCKLKQDKEGIKSVCLFNASDKMLHICVRQYHPLNHALWWRYMLTPLAFLQGYLLRYEYANIDDYFAQIEFSLHAKDDVEIELALVEQKTGRMVEKSFYPNLRKDQYLASKTEICYFRFEFQHFTQRHVCNINTHQVPLKRFVRRWRLVRAVPAIVTYGGLGVLTQNGILLSMQNHIYEALLAIPLVLLAYYLLYCALKKIFLFTVRCNGGAYNDKM